MKSGDKQQLPSRNWNAAHLVQVKLHQYVVIPVRSSTVFLHTVSCCCSVFTEQYSRPFNKRTLNRLSFFIQCKAYSAKQEKIVVIFRLRTVYEQTLKCYARKSRTDTTLSNSLFRLVTCRWATKIPPTKQVPDYGHLLQGVAEYRWRKMTRGAQLITWTNLQRKHINIEFSLRWRKFLLSCTINESDKYRQQWWATHCRGKEASWSLLLPEFVKHITFLGRLSCFLYFGAAFKKTIFLLAFVGYYYSYLGATSLLGACETDNC